MKKLTLLSIVFVLMQTIGAMAQTPKIVSVSQFPDMKPDYADIQAAIDAVEAGTKIYVYSGVYNGFTVNKQVTIIGPGYFLAENPQNHAMAMSVIIKGGEINIGSLANGSIIQGLTIQTRVKIENSQNITLKNCYVTNLTNNQGLNIVVTGSSNIIIKCNYIINNDYYTNAIDVSTSTSVKIHNNCITQNLSGTAVTISNQSISYLSNNIIFGSLRCENTFITNNIYRGMNQEFNFAPYDWILTDCTIQNNISVDNTFGTSNGNKYIEDFSTVFLSPSGSTDGQWQLKEGSPAIGAGFAGTDCGMYYGVEPYKLSGISDIPVIYEFNAKPAAGTQDKLEVKLKVRTN